MNQDLIQKVEKHELEISYIKETLAELAKYSKETSQQLQRISESLSKQEVILTRISNIEASQDENHKVLHKRIDSIEKIINNEKNGVTLRIEKLEAQLEKVKHDLVNRPCASHNVLETKINHIESKLANQHKVIWLVIGTIVSVVITGIVGSHLK